MVVHTPGSLFSFGEIGQRLFLQPPHPLEEPAVILQRIPGYRCRMTPGQNVVKLVEQQNLPQPPNLLPGIGHPRRRSGHAERLQSPESSLPPAVLFFEHPFVRERSPVHLQIEIPLPHRQVPGIPEIPPQEFRRRGEPLNRNSRELPLAVEVFQHLIGGTASAVAVPEHLKRFLHPVLILQRLPMLRRLIRIHPGDEMHRRYAGEHLAPVHPLPDKMIVGKPVGIVPRGHFVGDKVANPRFPQNLGEHRRIAEHIGKPAVIHIHAEFLLEELLPQEHLANQTLRANHIAVRLHVHGAHNLPATLGDPPLHPFEQGRIVELQHLIGPGLGVGIGKFGITIHQVQLNQHGSGILLHRLPHPPEVGDIEMGMAHAGQPSFLGEGMPGTVHLLIDEAFYRRQSRLPCFPIGLQRRHQP